ncbi:MAG: hypothetical protein ACXWWO_01335 [Candidatus Limnocylindria bacterium]
MTTALPTQALDLSADLETLGRDGIVGAKGAFPRDWVEGVSPEEHDLTLTADFAERLPKEIRQRLLYRVVDDLEPITQRHDIEGLVMGVES